MDKTLNMMEILEFAWNNIGSHAFAGSMGGIIVHTLYSYPKIEKKIDKQTEHLDKKIDQLIEVMKK